jgi:hypothetical protein
METEQPDSHRLSRVSGLVALAGLLAALAGGYLYYQSDAPLEVSSELQQNPTLPAPSTEGTAAPGIQSDAVAKPSSQQAAADANAPTGNPPDQGSQTPLPSIIAGVQVRYR